MSLADFLPVMAGPFVGSFLGVVVRRLPRQIPIGLARSACESCGRRLTPLELTPLLSYAVLRGRCRSCQAQIGAFSPAIELAALAAACWVVLVEPDPIFAWVDCVLAWVLLALAWIDWEHRRLPDALTLPLLLAGLAATWWLEPWVLFDHAIGAAGGYLAFRLLALLYAAWRGREGLGHGDAKLLACAGAWVGWQRLNEVVLLGALASIGAAVWVNRGRSLSGATAVPFGPGLALGLLTVRLHG